MSDERDTDPENDAPATPRVPTPPPPAVTRPSPQVRQDTRHEPTWEPERLGTPPPATDLGPAVPPAPSSERTVLVIDDEHDLRESLRMALEEGGYRVEVAENGLEGMRAMGHNYPRVDVVILDLEMPKLSGYDVLSVVQAWSCLDWLPVIILSGKPRRPDREVPEEFIYIRKGDDPTKLLELVKKLAEQSRDRRRAR